MVLTQAIFSSCIFSLGVKRGPDFFLNIAFKQSTGEPGTFNQD